MFEMLEDDWVREMAWLITIWFVAVFAAGGALVMLSDSLVF